MNSQNNNGDTPLHAGLHGAKMTLKSLKLFLTSGANVHMRNYEGRSVLHEAVKYYHLGIPAIDLLLEHGASLNAIDDQGATVLHDALKNPLVTLATIKMLLEYGAHPDCRDNKNYPPLAYCELSCLRPAEKELAAKLLLQYTVINKLYNDDNRQQLQSGSGLMRSDEVLCLHFCKDVTKRNEWSTFRDSCIAEIISMARLSVGNKNLLKLIINRCYKRNDEALNSPGKEVLSRLDLDEYPIFGEILISLLKECDFNL